MRTVRVGRDRTSPPRPEHEKVLRSECIDMAPLSSPLLSLSRGTSGRLNKSTSETVCSLDGLCGRNVCSGERRMTFHRIRVEEGEIAHTLVVILADSAQDRHLSSRSSRRIRIIQRQRTGCYTERGSGAGTDRLSRRYCSADVECRHPPVGPIVSQDDATAGRTRTGPSVRLARR